MTMVMTVTCVPPPRRYAAKALKYPDLKPCPFCGSDRIMIDRCSPQAECWDCRAMGPPIANFLDHADGDWTMAAIFSWNTRADDPDEEDEA